MACKYDLFLELIKKEYSDIILKNKTYYLNQLIEENLVEKKTIKETKKSKQIYSILMFCLNNDLDYEFYTRPSTINFLESYFLEKNQTLAKNTITKIRNKLEKDSFITYLSKKPLNYIILNHTFFKELLDYFNKKYKEKTLKINLDKKLKSLSLKKPKKDNVYFVHNSLQLEGNLLTLRQTQNIIKNNYVDSKTNLKDVYEITNYNKTLNYIKNLDELSIDKIKKIHKLTLEHEDHAGQIREEDVFIKGNKNFKICHHTKIDQELKKILDPLNKKQKNILNICKKAAYIHNQFQFIHPFLDGNSRTARLLTKWYFELHNIQFNLPLGFTTKYVTLTKGYNKREDKKLEELFKLIIMHINQN